jgi:hypothetical protein
MARRKISASVRPFRVVRKEAEPRTTARASACAGVPAPTVQRIIANVIVPALVDRWFQQHPPRSDK